MTATDEWGDYIVPVTVDVRVAHWHEAPEDAAERMLRDSLTVRSIYNWEGRFAIVTDIRIPETAA